MPVISGYTPLHSSIISDNTKPRCTHISRGMIPSFFFFRSQNEYFCPTPFQTYPREKSMAEPWKWKRKKWFSLSEQRTKLFQSVVWLNSLSSCRATGTLGSTGLETILEFAVDGLEVTHAAGAGGLAALGLFAPVVYWLSESLFHFGRYKDESYTFGP